jgi:hypothetical protein
VVVEYSGGFEEAGVASGVVGDADVPRVDVSVEQDEVVVLRVVLSDDSGD